MRRWFMSIVHPKISAVAVIILALLITYYFGYVRNMLRVFDRSLGNTIELWDRYEPTNETLGQGICDNKEFGTVIERVNSQPRNTLHLDGGVQLIVTDNPLRWRNSEFRDFYYFTLSKCRTTKQFIPVRAYRDRLLWKNACSDFFQNSFVSPCKEIQQSLTEWESNNALSSNEAFNEAGIRFRTPRGYHHALVGGFNGGYYYFSFYADGSVGGFSGINLFVPLESDLDIHHIAEELGFTLTPPDFPTAKLIALDGRRGVTVTERHIFPESPPYPWEGEYIFEYYSVPYSNAPLIVVYHHASHDNTMQPYWEMMHDTWKFD